MNTLDYSQCIMAGINVKESAGVYSVVVQPSTNGVKALESRPSRMSPSDEGKDAEMQTGSRRWRGRTRQHLFLYSIQCKYPH